MSSRDNNMPWARQNEGSPARKKIPMILSSKRHVAKAKLTNDADAIKQEIDKLEASTTILYSEAL